MQLLISNSDKLAFTVLYDRFSEAMLNYFYKMFFGNRDKANDFLHDLFLKIITQPSHFDQEKNFKRWIYTVAHNMCKNEFRRMQILKRNKEKININRNELESIDNNIDKVVFKYELNRLLAEASTTQRSTFILRFQEGLSIKEISEIMDCSDGTVKSRLFYVVKKVAKKLRHFDPEDIVI